MSTSANEWAHAQVAKAQALAGHQEEPTGHVCRDDCTGCNDPVGQLQQELNRLSQENFLLKNQIAGHQCVAEDKHKCLFCGQEMAVEHGFIPRHFCPTCE